MASKVILIHRSTTGNFGPGRASVEVNNDSVTTAPEHEEDDGSNEDSAPLAQLREKRKLNNAEQGANN